MDTITIKSLQYFGRHGYYEEERRDGNQFELDVTARGNFRGAAEQDRLEGAFDYELVDKIARAQFEGPSVKLIETLCGNIGDRLFEKSKNITSLTVSVRKLNPPIKTPAAYAEITMTWKR